MPDRDSIQKVVATYFAAMAVQPFAMGERHFDPTRGYERSFVCCPKDMLQTLDYMAARLR
jgi:hypothetical protein